jgi:hypothetical protein
VFSVYYPKEISLPMDEQVCVIGAKLHHEFLLHKGSYYPEYIGLPELLKQRFFPSSSIKQNQPAGYM